MIPAQGERRISPRHRAHLLADSQAHAPQTASDNGATWQQHRSMAACVPSSSATKGDAAVTSAQRDNIEPSRPGNKAAPRA